MKFVSTLILGSIASLATLAACKDNNASTETNTTGATVQAPTPAMTPDAAKPEMAIIPPTTGAPNTTAISSLNDAQILQVTHTANSGEIAQAKLALDKAKDARVKKLAQMMLSDHTDADKKGADIASKETLTLSDSPTSLSVKNDGDHTLDSLKSKTGADFDKAYVDAQVTEHQAVLDTIDNKLIPNAKDADVKSFIQTIRPKIADHLQHAQKLQTDLAK